MKSFETWTLEDLELTFGLTKIKETPILTQWLSATTTISEKVKEDIVYFQELLTECGNTWNEDELKMHFIGPFLMLVKFTTNHFKSFTQRMLQCTINDIEVSGKVDFMVATGKQKPRNPFFFIHEYKPARRAVNDPDGQLLIEMLAAQTLNQDHRPLFGVVVEGKLWSFVVLEGKNYIISQSYDCTKDEIYQIYAILCKVKDYIEAFLAEEK